MCNTIGVIFRYIKSLTSVEGLTVKSLPFGIKPK